VDAIPAAKARGLQVVIPAERSGQTEFIFEHGDDSGDAIERADPDAVKALVGYNPVADAQRPQLAAEAIDQLAADGLRPDWWKLEGNNDPRRRRGVATAAAPAAEIGWLVLGRGQDRESVTPWVKAAATAGGFMGFAEGGTLRTDSFTALLRGEIDDREAVNRIANAYLDIVSAYRRAALPRQLRRKECRVSTEGPR
jgi:myo-inositol catabolism protein IolC